MHRNAPDNQALLEFDDLGPAIARWLAPYVAAELERARQQTGDRPAAELDYDDEMCRRFVGGLKTPTLTKATTLFLHLNRSGRVDSVQLTKDLSLGTPRNLSGPLTTPLKRRAKKLGLPLPWDEGVTDDDRTLWRDRDGIADRMLQAIQNEQQYRHKNGSPSERS